MKAKVLCDDDHFASSTIHVRTCNAPIGVELEIHAQMGKPNFAFLHPAELDRLIAVLKQARTEMLK